MTYDFDLAVIGAGSGGYGAALAAARRGLRVLLVEAAAALGGTSTLGGVNTWEPGMSGGGFSSELFGLLLQQSDAIGLSRTTKFYSQDKPWGMSEIDRTLSYEQSLKRSGVAPEDWVRVTFEPQLMAAAMEKLLRAAGVTIAFNSRFVGGTAADRNIEELTFVSPKGEWSVNPRLVVDSTAGVHVARQFGCATALAEETAALYGEPSAPAVAQPRVNGVSLCFRVSRAKSAMVEPLHLDDPAEPYVVTVSMTQYPNGDINMNPLPIMEGAEYSQMVEREGLAAARAECEQRVRRLWFWLQTKHCFDNWRITAVAPMTGVREGPRLVARTVLTELDVRAGWNCQTDRESAIAYADHALDVHGAGHMCRELEQPYGVPYECLLPMELDNLAVACRGAGFSHIAASSCRLSRTMMDLGHAAGIAAAVAIERDGLFPDVPISAVREMLDADNSSLLENCFAAVA